MTILDIITTTEVEIKLPSPIRTSGNVPWGQMFEINDFRSRIFLSF